MEGLIPLVYKAIVQYTNQGEQAATAGGVAGGSSSSLWFNDSPSYAYMRLPGDSGRFQGSCNPSRSPSAAANTTSQIVVATGIQSPLQMTTRRAVK